MIKITKGKAILLILFLVLLASLVNSMFISSTHITGSAVAEVAPIEFPGLSLAIIVASALAGYVLIKQHHGSK